MNISTEYRQCTNCVMDTSDPMIQFDSDGVCDHCHDFTNHVKRHWEKSINDENDVNKIIQKIKKDGKNKEYDCIIGLSGGIDSSYMLHVAVTKFNLRPLVFHVDGGWNSEIAVNNIYSIVDKLGLDLYTEVINWDEMREFQLAFFKAGVPYLDIPQDHAFIAALYKYAEKYNIKYIFNGGNFSTECVQYPLKYYYYGTDMIFLNDIIKKHSNISFESYPFSSIFRHKLYLKYIKGITVVKLLNLIPYFKNNAIKVLIDQYNYKPYQQKHFESRFTRFFEGYWLPMRFGFDPRRVQLSSLILTGQLQRNEALEILNKPPLSEEQINEEIYFIASKLGISIQELTHYFSIPKKYYWDYKNQSSVFKFGASVLNLLGIEKTKKRKF
ncbi:LPS biosynthesis protein WbpG [Thermaurantimonas aggregans]|uniref:LPS biosynthesis protein WbpG n=1 Tax=Thermaurantimonas aggregans TaxID=2173829 RepID=A0A401XJW0_9FLAO|nr:N-acetyl sugar amidotransferase [Thermaurantimonas aggregans]MCX8148604.1 N-acetyl sugar amidotransferase [Thermaurantimonas aggregans]GCD77327.1 LPS biosynthesis protein WbpG [Thermaurantimonas aggregans]